MTPIYLDNAATTPLLPQVVDAMIPWLREQHGNPSSVHAHGRAARVAVERAREHIAAMIGADPREIVFTAGGTESDNAALHMTLHIHAQSVDTLRILSSPAEHHAVHVPLAQLAGRGATVDMLPVNAGGVPRLDDIRRGIEAAPMLCALMHVNNETGGILPLGAVGEMTRAHGTLLHSDIVQSAGKLPLDVHDMGVDFAAMSAHKIHGPKGVGALYVRSGIDAEAFIVGGGQERGRRGGTENVAGIVGFGEAARLATSEREERAERWKAMRQLLRTRLIENFPTLLVNEETEDAEEAEDAVLPNILSVSFPHDTAPVDGEMLLMNCDLAGVSVSGGSACTAGSVEASHVMRAVGHDAQTGAATLRISFGATTTHEEVEEGSLRILRVLQDMS